MDRAHEHMTWLWLRPQTDSIIFHPWNLKLDWRGFLNRLSIQAWYISWKLRTRVTLSHLLQCTYWFVSPTPPEIINKNAKNFIKSNCHLGCCNHCWGKPGPALETKCQEKLAEAERREDEGYGQEVKVLTWTMRVLIFNRLTWVILPVHMSLLLRPGLAAMKYGEEAHLVEDPDEMKLTPGIVKCEQQP